MAEFTSEDLAIKALGERTIDSPLDAYFREVGKKHAFYGDDARVLLDHDLATIRHTFETGAEPLCFEAAGPRRKIFFQPENTICAIVTCGGLCPGLNDVIRSIVMQAYYRYGVPRTLGIPYGFEGLIPDYGHRLINLTPGYVTTIHRFGGTDIGTSRGPQDTVRMVD
ncbi:MAG: 6-phosphofructokinase, partial [Terrimicrobiaceae bacterium]